MLQLIASVLTVLLLAGCGAATKEPPAGEVRGQTQTLKWSAAPEMKIDPEKSYQATIKTSLGDIQIELFAKDSPITVNNFVFLARAGYYDNVLFHRVVKGFMIQTGDPQGTGTGGPGYTIQDELPPKHSYEPGIVAMAKTNRPNSAGSQFFICNGPNCKGLDQLPDYPQFGRVTSGMDVVEKISSVPTTRGSDGAMSKPIDEVWIKTVLIEEK